jgi:hypothetical protein
LIDLFPCTWQRLLRYVQLDHAPHKLILATENCSTVPFNKLATQELDVATVS